MAGEPLVVNPVHPLEGLGLDTRNADAPALRAALGAMPGAAEARNAAEVNAGQRFAQNQGAQVIAAPQGTPAGEPVAPQADPAVAFNRQFQEQQTEAQKAAEAVVAEPGQEEMTISRDDYDFLVGLIEDQGAAMQSFQSGQAPVAGPSSIPGFAPTPQAQPGQPGQPGALPAGAQAPQSPVAPIAVPTIAETEISETDFEKITTDRSAMAKYLAQRDQKTAALVTEQLSSTVLPHVYTHFQNQLNEQNTIDQFLRANPDFAEHPDAVLQAVAEAKVALPYAKADRLMYYAGQRLRSAMKTNENIQSNIHDLRGLVRGRRAPTVNNAVPVRRGPGNEAPVNPFSVMKEEMKAHAAKDKDILHNLGLA